MSATDNPSQGSTPPPTGGPQNGADSNSSSAGKGTADAPANFAGNGAFPGGHAGSHDVKDDLVRLVGPATGSELNTLKTPLIPVACWRVDDVRFLFDSSFVLPEAQVEIKALADLVKAQSGLPLSIFGHADPTGSDDYNKNLSGRRARAIYAMLLRDAAAWEDLYTHPQGNDNWKPASLPYMLDKLGYPASSSGAGTPDPEAVKKFQTDNGLKPDGDAGPQTRQKLFLAYMDALCGPDLKLQPTDFLGQGADPDGKGGLQGCSEFNPVLVFSKAEQQKYDAAADKTARNQDNSINRRVVIFLFRKGTKIDTSKWPCPSYKEGVAKCKKRFWSDGETRRSNQALRREYKDTGDTFGCRFYDRLASESPCEQGLVFEPLFRITLTLGDIDALFPAIAAKTHTDDGVRKRLQAIGFLYDALDSPTIAQTAQDAWAHFKTVISKPDDAAASDELQAMIVRLIVDGGKLPDKGAFTMLRVPGTYCVTIAHLRQRFFGNPAIAAPNSAHFSQEAAVWNANPALGLIPLLAKVEEFNGSDWKPARPNLPIHFQLLPADPLASGGAASPPDPRNTPHTNSVNRAAATGAVSTFNMTGHPKQYIDAERARNPVTANDPLLDNAHKSVGGKRGNAVAGTIREQIDGAGTNLGNLLEITTTHPGYHDKFNFTAASQSGHANAAVAMTNNAGEASVIFMPSRTGGDRYKIRAFLDPVNGKASEGTEDFAVSAETGTLVVWRILRVSKYLRWDYPAGMSPLALGIEQGNCGGALDNFDIAGVMTNEYKRAFLDVTVEPGADTPHTLTDAEWSAMATAVRARLIARTALPAGNPDRITFSNTYNMNALLPAANLTGGIIKIADPAEYNANHGPGFLNVPNPANTAAAANYWRDAEKILMEGMDEVMQFFTQNAISGLTIIQAPAVTSLEADFVTGMNTIGNQNLWQRSGWGTDRRGCFVVFGTNVYSSPTFPYDATHNALHETGHVLYGVHQYTDAAQFNTPAGTGGIFDEHDYHDLCIMGYMSMRPGNGDGFCGRCVLNQAGWNTRPMPANGPPP